MLLQHQDDTFTFLLSGLKTKPSEINSESSPFICKHSQKNSSHQWVRNSLGRSCWTPFDISLIQIFWLIRKLTLTFIADFNSCLNLTIPSG